MDERNAKCVAKDLGGEAYHTGGNIWVVIERNDDGTVNVTSDDGVFRYDSRSAFLSGAIGTPCLPD